MEKNQKHPSFFKSFVKEFVTQWYDFTFGWRSTWAKFRNGLRKRKYPHIDYIIFPLSGELPERDSPPRSFFARQLPFLGKTPLSIQTLMRHLKQIETAENAAGILLILQGVGGGFGKLQTVRQGIQRLRAAGKNVVVYTPFLTTAHYFIATAANKIVVPPTATFDVVGFYSEASFYKDLLHKVGIEIQGLQISPYKTGVDALTKSEASAEYAEMTNWLLDERFNMLVQAIVEGRNLTEEKVKQLIDQAPLFAETAVEEHLIDHLAYEDELEALLTPKETAAEADKTEDKAEKSKHSTVQFLNWRRAAPHLTTVPKRRQRQVIGVVSLTGAIMRGSSQDPPINLPIPIVGGKTAGHQTLTAVLRQAEKNSRLAALIFHVDSPGGDSLASDLIGREIERIGKKIPVVVYMGDVAASGGYYVSALAHHIVCQPGTITGSIGVFMLKPNLEALNEKLEIQQTEFKRGQNSGLYRSTKALTEPQKEQLYAGIKEIYRQFKAVVSRGRSLPFTELDPICNGRVWTGRQALELRLVDSLGSFEDAVKIASRLAKLPQGPQDEIKVVDIFAKGASYRWPKPVETATYVGQLLSENQHQHLLYRPLMIMPYKIE